eukprot:g854.t1
MFGQRPGSRTIEKKLNRKLPTPLPNTSPTPSVLLRQFRGSTPLYDKEVDFINKNPAQHPPSPSLPPSTAQSSLSSSTFTNTSNRNSNVSNFSSYNNIPRPPPTGQSHTSNRSIYEGKSRRINTRQRRLDKKRDDYFAAKAIEMQEKEIRKLERQILRQERQQKLFEKSAAKRKKLREDALKASNTYYDKDDKLAIEMIDWIRNYCDAKAKGTLDTFSDLFDGFDSSRDGFLNISEFKERMQHLGGFDRVSTPNFDRAFKMIDVNKDGEISFNEMRYAVVRDEMGKKIDAYKRAAYNEGRFRNRNEKLSHIRKVRGSTSMSAKNPSILSQIIPLTIDQKWLKNKNGKNTLKTAKHVKGAVLDASTRRFSKDSSIRSTSTVTSQSKKPPSRRYNVLTQTPVV